MEIRYNSASLTFIILIKIIYTVINKFASYTLNFKRILSDW